MADTSKIVIPIEISTEESEDYKQLIQDLKSVEHIPEEATKKKPTSKKFKSTSGAPIKTTYEEDPTGIFAGEMEDYAYPDVGRDKRSKQAVNQDNQFKKMKKDVDDLKNILSGKGSANAFGYASKASMFFTNPGTALSGIFMEYAPVIGSALVVSGIMDQVITQLTMPGGLLDIRFERKIQDEVDPLLERNTKAEISAGQRDVRVTSYAGQRQTQGNQVVATEQFIKAGQPVFSSNLESVAKGVL